MIKIIVFVLCCAVLTTLLSNYQKAVVIPLVVCVGCIVFLFVFELLESTVCEIQALSQRVGVQSVYIKMLLKVIGVSYLCEFAASICRDSGQSSFAMKIDMAAKLLILSQSLPVFSELLRIIQEIIPS